MDPVLHTIYSRKPDIPDPEGLRAELGKAGVEASVSAEPGEAPGWWLLEVGKAEWGAPVLLARCRNDEESLNEELGELLDLIEDECQGGAQDFVRDVLLYTVASYQVEVPGELAESESGQAVVQAIARWLCSTTDGLLYAEGAGFYDEAGDLVLDLEE